MSSTLARFVPVLALLALAIAAQEPPPATPPPKPNAPRGGPPQEPISEPKVEATTAGSVTLSFEDLAPGALPKDWVVAETNSASKPAKWQVREAEKAPDGKKILGVAAENSGSTFNLLLSEKSYPADLVVEVKLHAEEGTEDQGGGLMWRVIDANNYYIARWNPLENNLRAYKVEGGKRTMLKSATFEADPAAWHDLKIAMEGTKSRVWFDGESRLEFEDPTFAAAGKVGLWTKADASTSFDVLRIAWEKAAK